MFTVPTIGNYGGVPVLLPGLYTVSFPVPVVKMCIVLALVSAVNMR